MIDSDMQEYVTAPDGTPLSLEEMRAEVIAGRELNVHRNSDQAGVEYMQAYWAKNLYWFTIHMTYGYGLEGARMLPDKYVSLVPPDYRIPLRHSFAAQNVTTNASAFWRG